MTLKMQMGTCKWQVGFIIHFTLTLLNIANITYSEFFGSISYDFKIYFSTANQEIYALKLFEDKLFIGGDFSGFSGKDYVCYVDSNEIVSPYPNGLGDGLNGRATCFGEYDRDLMPVAYSQCLEALQCQILQSGTELLGTL